ncbi:MAG: hypothetical protein EPN85_04440 [Bacteroidetes bacterium]|nr:MAG: hypothetical protein EPN85_04440 [Bacteroidota bacterium]
MNKDKEDKLTDTLIDIGLTMNKLLNEVKELRGDVQQIQKRQAQTNYALGEMRLSYMKLDKSFNKYAESNSSIVKHHEIRITHLEEKTPGGAYIASEPAVQYKKKKRK